MNKVHVTQHGIYIVDEESKGLYMEDTEIRGDTPIMKDHIGRWVTPKESTMACTLEELHQALLLLKERKDEELSTVRF